MLTRRTIMRYAMILMAAAASTAVPCRADVVVLPDAVFSGQVNCGAGPGVQTDSAGTFSVSAGCATATLSYRVVPVQGTTVSGEASVTASGNNTKVTGAGIGYYSSGVSAEVTYFFEVVGSISEPVPVDISASGSASATSANNSDVYGTAGIITPFGDATACSSPSLGACPVPSPTVGIVQNPFSVTLRGNVTPERIYEIDVSAGGSAAGFFGSSFSASIDPQVSIDPSFADAQDFSLEFSPNPPSLAPEPSSMPLLLVSCLILAMALRLRSARRRRVS